MALYGMLTDEGLVDCNTVQPGELSLLPTTVSVLPGMFISKCRYCLLNCGRVTVKCGSLQDDPLVCFVDTHQPSLSMETKGC